MRKQIGILCLFALALSSASASASYFRLNALYQSEETEQSTSSKSSRTLLDLGGGYTWPSGFTLGALYATEKRDNGTSTTDRTSYGPTLGYMQEGEGFFILGTYFFKSEYEEYDGDGYGIDVGYRFKVSSVGLGLQMSYRHFKYDELSGASVNPPLKHTYLDPYFTLWIEF